MHRQNLRLYSCLICLLILLAYRGVWHHDYASDAVPIIVNNPTMSAPFSFKKLLLQSYWSDTATPGKGLYRPLTLVSFWLVQQTGLSASLDHSINLSAHLMTTIILFFLLLRYLPDRRIAFLISLIWALHPVHVEVVANVVGRSDIFATLLTIAAIYILLLPSLHQRWRHGLAVGFWLTALLFKESAIVGCLIIPWIAYGLVPQRKSEWLKLTRYLCLVALFYLGWRAMVLGGLDLNHSQEIYLGDSWYEKRWTALAFLSLLWQKLLLPWPLLPDYTRYFVMSPWEYQLRAVCSLVILFGLIWQLKRSRWWKSPPLYLAIATLYLSYLPVSNLFNLTGINFAERLLYLPTALALPMLAKAAKQFNQKYLLAAGCIIVALYLPTTYRQAKLWENDDKLIQATMSHAQGIYAAHYQYGRVLLSNKQIAQARVELLHAAILDRTRFEPRLSLSNLESLAGNYDLAISYIKQALKLAPSQIHPPLYANYYTLCITTHQWKLAAKIWQKLESLNTTRMTPQLQQ